MYINGLKKGTDERFLDSILAVYGKIVHSEIRRFQSGKKVTYENDYPVDQVIHEAFVGEKFKFKS